MNIYKLSRRHVSRLSSRPPTESTTGQPMVRLSSPLTHLSASVRRNPDSVTPKHLRPDGEVSDVVTHSE